MAVQYNPLAITDGLVFCVDPANTKSYSQSGVTLNNFVGTTYATATMFNNTSPFVNSNFGVFGFDGTNDYLQIPTGIFRSGTSFPWTFSFWFKTSSTGILFGVNGVPGDNFGSGWPGIIVDANGKLKISIFYDGAGNYAWTSTNAVNDNKWYNVTVTAVQFYPGAILQSIYFNGILVDGPKERGISDQTNTTNYYFCTGRYAPWLPDFPTNQYLNCQISNISLYHKTLNASEVLQNFNALRGRFGI